MYSVTPIFVATLYICCIYNFCKIVMSNNRNVSTMYLYCRYTENKQKYISTEYFFNRLSIITEDILKIF